MSNKKSDKQKEEYKVITVNRKAFYEYEIIEKFEAGMALTGSEVKSIREGKVNLKDSYITLRNMEAFLLNSHISMYSNASYNNHDPERDRKLLLNKRELQKLDKKIKTKGVTIVPLRMYFSLKGKVKLEIAMAKGKHSYDKKQTLKDRDIQRDTERQMRSFR